MPRAVLIDRFEFGNLGTHFGSGLRGLARHGRDVQTGLHAMWRAAKMLLYGREAIPPRKVN